MFRDTYKNSPILGKSLDLTDKGKEKLDLLINNSPLAVFQALNKKFNEKGFCSHIVKLLDKDSNF